MVKQHDKQKINVLFDTSPLSNANKNRGVGMYARCLLNELKKHPDVNLVKPTQRNHDVKFDLIHYPFFDLFFPTLPIYSSKQRVVTIHDVIPLIFPKYYPVGIKGTVAFNKQKLALKTVDAVITDSQSSKNDIHQFLKYPLKKIHVVPLAGNPNIQQTDDKKITKTIKQRRLPEQYILYVGDINYNKNLPQLVKAIKYLPEDINLILIGKSFVEQEIPEWQWLTSQIELSDVKDRIVMINDVKNDDELSALYSGAICYVQPSLYEGFGLPVLEAMQAKVPVVSCKNSSLVEIGGGHVVYTDSTAESLADGVKQVLSWVKSKRNNVTDKAFLWANTYSWEKTAIETAKVYQSIL